jgi:hypothetical protein
LWNWLAPLTAAAVVAALTIALVTVRQLRNDGGTPPPVSVPPATALTIPRYYAALNDTSGVFEGLPGASRTVSLVIGDARTGSAVATVAPPRGQMFAGVTGAADDRTFVVAAAKFPVPQGVMTTSPLAWYRLHVTPGAPKPAVLTRLSIPGQPAGTQVDGISLSPDGGKLAVYYQPGVWDSRTQHPLTLRVYSVSTGRVLRTWTHNTTWAGSAWYWGRYSNTSLTWLADGHSLAFEFGIINAYNGPPFGAQPADPTVRTISLTGPGRDLIAASQVVFRVKSSAYACDTLQLTANGKTVLCGSYDGGSPGSAAHDPKVTVFSVGTGKPRLVYRLPGVWDAALADVLWSNPDGSKLAIAVNASITTSRASAGYQVIGELASGKFTTLKIPLRHVPYAGEAAF